MVRIGQIRISTLNFDSKLALSSSSIKCVIDTKKCRLSIHTIKQQLSHAKFLCMAGFLSDLSGKVIYIIDPEVRF